MNWSLRFVIFQVTSRIFWIIPNDHLIPTVNDVTAEHEQALGRMITVAAKIAEQEGIAADGYRFNANTNRHGVRRCITFICTCWVAVRLAQCSRIKVCRHDQRMHCIFTGLAATGGLSNTPRNSGK